MYHSCVSDQSKILPDCFPLVFYFAPNHVTFYVTVLNIHSMSFGFPLKDQSLKPLFLALLYD